MDKIAINNHVVNLRKEIKNAMAMVGGNLVRKMKKLKLEGEKVDDDEKKKKLESKVERLYSELKLIKTLDTYPIAKGVILKPDKKFWDDLLSDNKATPQQRLTCRILLKNNVQRCIAGFRDQNEDCDEWLEEYFEFREKKKDLLTAAGIKRRPYKKASKSGPRRLRDPTPAKKPKRDNCDKTSDHNNKMTRKRGKPAPKSDIKKTSPKPKKADQVNSLHPSWESKRREKELLKQALSGEAGQQPKRIVLSSES